MQDIRVQIITTYAEIFKEALKQCPQSVELAREADFWEKVLKI